MITSPANPRVKAALALRQRREREARGLFLIEGRTEIERAQAAGITIEEVMIEEGTSVPAHWLSAILTLAPPVFAKIAYGRGMVAVARQPTHALDSFDPPAPELILVVEAIEKPGNLGAMLRTADATGAAVIAADPVTDLTNPNVVRASLGTLFTVPVAKAPAGEVVRWLTERGIKLIATTVDHGTPPWSHDLAGPVALAVGAEHHGLSPGLISLAQGHLHIPMAGSADSLNAAATAAMVLYEAVRQRSQGR